MYLDREFHKLLISHSSPRISVKIQNAIKYINGEIHRTQKKLSIYNGYTTSGFMLLINLVYRGMSDELARYDNDYDRLFEVLEFQREYLTRTFGSTGGGGRTHSNFFISNKSCREYIFSVQPRDLENTYPLDKGADGWRHYRAFRFIDTDSNDYSLNIYSGQLKYIKDLPRYAVFTFDPVAAILQYNALKEEISIAQYVHQYLILPALSLDNIKLWTLGVYNDYLSSRERDFTEVPMVTVNYIHMPIQMKSAMQEISYIIDECKSGAITADRLVSSLPLPFHSTISLYGNTLYNKSTLDDINEYSWGIFMMYRRILNILVKVLSLTIQNPTTANSILSLKRAMNLLSSSGVTSGINDAYTKMFVRSSVDNLIETTEKLYRLSNI